MFRLISCMHISGARGACYTGRIHKTKKSLAQKSANMAGLESWVLEIKFINSPAPACPTLRELGPRPRVAYYGFIV